MFPFDDVIMIHTHVLPNNGYSPAAAATAIEKYDKFWSTANYFECVLVDKTILFNMADEMYDVSWGIES